jgi:hypothetical protein
VSVLQLEAVTMLYNEESQKTGTWLAIVTTTPGFKDNE